MCRSLRCFHGPRQRLLLLQLHGRGLPEGLHGSAPVPERGARLLQPGAERPRRLRLHLQLHGAAAGGGRPSPPQPAGQLPALRRLAELQRLLGLPAVPPVTGLMQNQKKKKALKEAGLIMRSTGDADDAVNKKLQQNCCTVSCSLRHTDDEPMEKFLLKVTEKQTNL